MFARFALFTYAAPYTRATAIQVEAYQPISWSEARDRLIALGMMDRSLAGRMDVVGGWFLSIDKHDIGGQVTIMLARDISNGAVSA